MRVLSLDRNVKPTLPLSANDNANLIMGLFQNGPLFDMCLKQSTDRMITALLLTEIADSLEFIEEYFPFAVFAGIGKLLSNNPAKTPEESMAGAKRAPSSLVHVTISIGAAVLIWWSFNVWTTSRAARTP